MLDLFKSLLPSGRAWSSSLPGSTIRKLAVALMDEPSRIIASAKTLLSDALPSATTKLAEWEKQFGLIPSGDIESRRSTLEAVWRSLPGGQSPRYIEDTLQAAGFRVFVHEWWQLPVGSPPVARDPASVISDVGYMLVNKLNVTSFEASSLHDSLSTGGVDNYFARSNICVRRRVYPVPTDPLFFPYILYIGGPGFGDVANVPLSRRDELEDLLLSICPTQQWIGMIVRYTAGDATPLPLQEESI